MAYITPNSTITLYSGIDITAGQNIAFASRSAQLAYFNKHIVATNTKVQYVRRTGVLKVPQPSSVVAKCNYISFTNVSYENKLFFAKITNFEYINNGNTAITYTIDWWQTDMFDIKVEPCMINREQLTETDYARAKENPYLADIPELLTDEGIPAGREYETKDITRIENGTGYFPNLSASAPTIETYLQYTEKGNSITSYRLKENIKISPLSLCFAVCVAPFDVKSLDNTEYTEFIQNATVTSGFPLSIEDEWGSYRQNLARNYGIAYFSFTNDGSSETNTIEETISKLQTFINYLTGKDVMENILNLYLVPYYMVLSDLYIFNNDTPFVQNSGWRFNSINTLPESITDDFRTTILYIEDIKNNNIVNPKLDTFPFKYIRCIAPNGDCKEYNISNFLSANDGSVRPPIYQGSTPEKEERYNRPHIQFLLTNSLVGIPETTLLPYYYGSELVKGQIYSGQPLPSGEFFKTFYNGTNYNERMVFNGYPQLPFSTDAYLAFLANQYSAIMNDTTSYTEDSQTLSKIKGWTTAFGGAGTFALGTGAALTAAAVPGLTIAAMLAGGFSAMMSGVQSINESKKNQELLESAQNYYEKPQDFDKLEKEGDPNSIYTNSRAVNINDKYHPGSINGFDIYNMNRYYFTIQLVKLEEKYRDNIDTFFTLYGYRSGLSHKPRIMEYVQGGDNKPQFLPYNEKEVTYVKTDNFKCVGTISASETYIREMFNNGVRFLKGESL